MNNNNEQVKETSRAIDNRQYNYSLCRSSCSVCPYRNGLLKLLDHGNAIVPSLPDSQSVS